MSFSNLRSPNLTNPDKDSNNITCRMWPPVVQMCHCSTHLVPATGGKGLLQYLLRLLLGPEGLCLGHLVLQAAQRPLQLVLPAARQLQLLGPVAPPVLQLLHSGLQGRALRALLQQQLLQPVRERRREKVRGTDGRGRWRCVCVCVGVGVCVCVGG